MTNVCDANETRFISHRLPPVDGVETKRLPGMALVAVAPRWEKQTTRPHRADTCASRQVSALFGPHRWPDSSALQPLPFISFQLHKFRFHSIAFRRSQTAGTGRDSVAPGDSGIQRPRCFAYRPANKSAIRREASPDVFTKAKRSDVMSRIRGCGNKETELAVANLLRQHGVTGWRRNQKIFGKPDFTFGEVRLALFVDGCFWHGCPKHSNRPSNNRAFWKKKLSANKRRDRLVTRTLQANGWRVLRIWEHDLRTRSGHCVLKIQSALVG